MAVIEPTIDLMVADTSKRFTELVKDKLADVKVKAFVTYDAEADKIASALRENPSSVLLLGPSWSRPERLAGVAEALAAFPNVSAILVADSLSTGLMRAAMRAGVKDVLPRAMEDDELRSAILRGNEIALAMRSAVPFAGQTAKVKKPKHETLARTLIVIGAKGGVGKSVIATNLAVALSDGGRARSTLLDLDIEYGDSAIMLQLTPKRTLYDILDDLDRLDEDMIRGFVTRHESGVELLASPLDPAVAGRVTGADVAKITRTLKHTTDYLVIDTPATFDERVEAALKASDDILLVSSLDVPSVKDAKLLLRTVNEVTAGSSKVPLRLIINRSDSRVGLEPEHIVSALGIDLFAAIPSCRQVPLSMNRGVPVVTEFPRSPAARALLEMTNKFTDGADQDQEVRDEVRLVEAR